MKKFLALLPTFLLAGITLFSQSEKRLKEFNISKSSLAVSGYDPVAYFTQSKAIKGSKNISLVYEGLTYYFATPQNRDLFKLAPDKYQPQYGGWCAYAMGASGEKVEVDPETFKIVNNKLYLFYNKFFNNTLTTWNKSEAALKGKADANWMKFYH